MPIRRLATSDNIIEALVRIMSTEAVLSYEQAAAALLHEGLNFSDDAGNAEDAIDYAIDFGVGAQELFIVEDWIVHPEALAKSKVYTHRITADDVSGEVIGLFPDCAAWLPALTIGVADMDGSADGDGGADLALGAAETADDTDVRIVALAVAGAAPVQAELIGLGTLDDSGAMLILPEGTFAAAGVHAGDLIALRLSDRVIHLDALPEAPGTEAPDHGDLASDATRPEDPGHSDAVVAHLRDVKAESTLIESVTEFVFRCIIADRTLFDTPTAPLTELLDAAGIHPAGDLIGDISEEAAATIRGFSAERTAEMYNLKTSQAQQLLELLDALDEAAFDGVAPDPEVIARAYPAFADPWFTFALAEESIKGRESAEALDAFTSTPLAGASRAVRAGLLYLQGRVRELIGDPVTAIANYRKSAQLHDSPFTLQRSALLEMYRGNYDASRALLDQSGALPSHPLYEDLARATRHNVPAEPTRKLGRNEPCWCGSGRKFKVCHGRSGSASPLSHRAPGLYDRATTYVFDAAPDEVLTLLGWANAAAGGTAPEKELVPVIVDLLLIEDHLMADFAEKYGAILPDDEVMVLEQWHLEANRSVFDVEAVVPGESMTLCDLRTGDRYEVVERSGSQQVQVGWFICTRVADVAGQYQLFGGIEPVALNQREALMGLLDSSPTASDLMARLAARFAPPAILSPEGDPLVICEARYDVPDPGALRAILDDLFMPEPESETEPEPDTDMEPALEPDTDTDEWMWSEEVGPDEQRPLASLHLTDDGLLITTTTEPRLERVLAMLGEAGADLIEVEVDRTDASEMMRRGRHDSLDEDEDEWLDDDEWLEDDDEWDDDESLPGYGMTPEVALANPEIAAAIANLIAKHEELWLEEPIPALSGLTPRQAAADPTRRDDLIRLLDSFPAKGSPHEMDGNRLRAALGL